MNADLQAGAYALFQGGLAIAQCGDFGQAAKTAGVSLFAGGFGNGAGFVE